MPLSGRTVLVTGAGGFLGSTIVRSLLQEDVHVRALLGAPGQRVIEPPAGVQTLRADICDNAPIEELTKGADAVIHAAGPPSVTDSFAAPVEYARVHVQGTVVMLEACRKVHVRKFIYISSAEIYGRPQVNPVTEEHPLEPRSPYGAAKAAAEQFVRAYAATFGGNMVILRPFSVYGPHLYHKSVLASIIEQAISGDAILVQDLRPRRDFCYSADVASAACAACAATLDGSVTVNIGSGIGTSIQELAEIVLQATGRRLPVLEKCADRRTSRSDIFHLVADTERAKKLLRWTPKVPLTDGLRRTLAWYREAHP
jgi:nucleoside-diphosphate-sugar epimerase